MSVWNLLYKELTGTHDYIKPNTPATQKQIAEVEKVLGCKLPTDLKELLLEIDGDNWFVFSTEQIIFELQGNQPGKFDCQLRLFESA